MVVQNSHCTPISGPVDTAHVQCISKASSAAKRTLLRVMHGVTLSLSLSLSLSSNHHLGTQILRIRYDHSLSGPPPTTKAKMLCKQKQKCVSSPKKTPKQISPYIGSHTAACRSRDYCCAVSLLQKVLHVFCDNNLIHAFARNHAYSGSRIQTI